MEADSHKIKQNSETIGKKREQFDGPSNNAAKRREGKNSST